MYLVYILKSDNKTYVGMTNNFFRNVAPKTGEYIYEFKLER